MKQTPTWLPIAGLAFVAAMLGLVGLLNLVLPEYLIAPAGVIVFFALIWLAFDQPWRGRER
jgi:hypothetical protein